MEQRRHDPLTAFLVGMLGIALFSGMDAVMKGLVLAIGVFATMLWRNLAGAIVTGALYLARRKTWPSASLLRLHIGRGALSTLMGFLFFWGIGRIPLAQAVALAFIAPVIALYLAAVLLHEKIAARTIAGSLLAFGGVLFIFVGQTRLDLGREGLLGSLAVLASAACYALNIILMRRQALLADPLEISFFQAISVTVILGTLVPVVGTEFPDAAHWPTILFAGTLAVVSSMLLSWAYARAEASYLATTEYTAFLWAALFGWLVFREPLLPWTVCGAALIVGGCIIAARRADEANPKLEAAP